MRVAVAIAEQGSLTRAAASLHQSSSAVSHTLLTLERELGVDLFHRIPRGMALTDAGRPSWRPRGARCTRPRWPGAVWMPSGV